MHEEHKTSTFRQITSLETFVKSEKLTPGTVVRNLLEATPPCKETSQNAATLTVTSKNI